MRRGGGAQLKKGVPNIVENICDNLTEKLLYRQHIRKISKG